ncbi:MAG: hypothetical protein RIB59_02695 [Rhodospirillales bacterium]
MRMRNQIRPLAAAFIFAGVLAGCQGTIEPQVSATPSSADWCADFYDLSPGTKSYVSCVENGGEPFAGPKLD